MLKKKFYRWLAASTLLLAISSESSSLVLAEEIDAPQNAGVEDYGGGTNTDNNGEEDLIIHIGESSSAQLRIVYSNGLPVDEGSLVRLSNGIHQMERMTDANGYVQFLPSDGLETGQTYQVSVNQQANVFSFTSQGDQEHVISLPLPGAVDPLLLILQLSYQDGSSLPVGTPITLTNLKDGSQFTKNITEEGVLLLTEADGLKKEVNYGISVDGTNIGSTFRYDLGGEKELAVVVPDYAKAKEVSQIYLILRYTNGLPVEIGRKVSLSHQDQKITKTIESAGDLSFNEEDGLILGQEYQVSVDGQENITSLTAEADQSYRVYLPLVGAKDPLQVELELHYKDGKKLAKGTRLTFRDLKSDQSFSKTLEEDGQLTLLESDGLKKEVNYGIEVDGTNIGYTFRYDLGGPKTLSIELPEYMTEDEQNNSDSEDSAKPDQEKDQSKPNQDDSVKEEQDQQDQNNQAPDAKEKDKQTDSAAKDSQSNSDKNASPAPHQPNDGQKTPESNASIDTKTKSIKETQKMNSQAEANSQTTTEVMKEDATQNSQTDQIMKQKTEEKTTTDGQSQKLPETGEASSLNLIHGLAMLILLAALSLFKKLTEEH